MTRITHTYKDTHMVGIRSYDAQQMFCDTIIVVMKEETTRSCVNSSRIETVVVR